MATVITSQNINAVTYASAEDITISSGAVLTIDAQEPADVSNLATLPGSFICITSGELRVLNNSTTDPLVLTVGNNAKDYRFEKNGIFRLTGAMIDLDAGTGAYQSWDFSASPLDTIPYPSYVEIEDSPGSDTYMPRLVFCTAGKTITYAKTLWGATGENGNVLFWNATTRTLESGDGTNGNVITSGCRVRIPNIYIHSNNTNATQASRTLIDLAPTGRMYASCIAFSDHIWISNSAPGETILSRVGFVGGFLHNSTNSPLLCEHVALQADTNTSAGNGWQSSNLLGPSSFDRIAVTHSIGSVGSNGICFSMSVALGILKFDNILAMVRARGSNSASSIETYNTPVPDGIMRNITAIGARLEFGDQSGTTFVNFKHTDQISDTSSATNAEIAVVLARCKNILFVNMGKAGKAAARSGLFSTDAQTENVQIFGGGYDCDNNTLTTLFTGSGKGLEVYNFALTNVPTGARISDSPTTFLSSLGNFYNVRGTLVGTALNDALCSATYDGLVGTPSGFATGFAGGVDFNSAHLLDSGLSTTSGNVVFAGFGDTTRNSFTGQAQLNQSGQVELPANGDSAILESLVFQGITDFAAADPSFAYTGAAVATAFGTTPPATMTVEFAIANPTGDFTAWAALNSTNLPLAIASLTDYDSNEGLRVRIRVTATTDDATRLFTTAAFATVYDSAYVAPDATVNLRGPEPTDTTTLYRFSDDTVIATFTGGGVHSFSAASYFQQPAYFIRRNADGFEIMRTRSTSQAIVLGSNGNADLFAGAQVQLAESSILSTLNALIEARLDVAISTRLAASAYTAPTPVDLAPTNAAIAALGTPLQTGAVVDADIKRVNGITVSGGGTEAEPWGPVA